MKIELTEAATPPSKKTQKPDRHPKLPPGNDVRIDRETYRRYMASEAWRIRRRRYFDKRKARCRACGKFGMPGVRIELHHLSYEHLGKEPNTDLAPLCVSCHTDVHDYQRKTSCTLRQATEMIISRARRRQVRQEARVHRDRTRFTPARERMTREQRLQEGNHGLPVVSVPVRERAQAL